MPRIQIALDRCRPVLQGDTQRSNPRHFVCDDGLRRLDMKKFAPSSTPTKANRYMQTPNVVIHRDTGAWRLQVWVSFAIAVFLCATGLSYLPGQDIDRAFMIMGYLFCLSATFVLSKFVRDNQKQKADTPMWRWVVYGAFFLAMALTGWGLWRMNINETYKAFLLVSWLYLITSTFTLAKTLRDGHDADLAEARLVARSSAASSQHSAQ